jgi:hypothetical protein
MKLIYAALLALAAANDDVCHSKHTDQTTCNADAACTWCQCGAVPSSCWTLENSKKLPSGVYRCDKQPEEMPVAELIPEYVNVPFSENPSNASGSNFVFLQKFPLGGVNLFFHTEVLVCPREGFSADDQKFLDGKIGGIGNAGFVQIDNSWWTTKTANCVELGYGGAMCETPCCGVPHGSDQTNYQLKSRRAVIGNADGTQKSLYIYGTGDFDGNVAWHDACDKKCWSTWKGTDYNPLSNNCNTFTSTILAMVYGLSEKKPHLGPSDLVTVHGHCPASKEIIVL